MKLDNNIINIINNSIERLNKINWFCNCGNSIENENLQVLFVPSWNQAQIYYNNVNWENTQLEARNTLTSFLHSKHQDKYLLWNEITTEAKKYVNGELNLKLNQYKEKYSLDQSFVDSVKWDILASIMENVYLEYKIPIFYLHLLGIYEKGNFPCGWNGIWPEGELIVF